MLVIALIMARSSSCRWCSTRGDTFLVEVEYLKLLNPMFAACQHG